MNTELDKKSNTHTHPYAPADETYSKTEVNTELDKKSNTHTHPYAASEHGHAYAEEDHVHRHEIIFSGSKTTLAGADLSTDFFLQGEYIIADQDGYIYKFHIMDGYAKTAGSVRVTYFGSKLQLFQAYYSGLSLEIRGRKGDSASSYSNLLIKKVWFRKANI